MMLPGNLQSKSLPMPRYYSLKRGRQRYTGWEQVSHFLKNLQFTLGFTHTVKSGTVLPWSNISWDGAEYVSDNQHRLSWQPYSKITNLKKPTVTSWEPVHCRRWINCSDTTRHLKSIIYSALLHIYMYLHTRLIESSHSCILQLRVELFFSSCLFWPNSLTCNLSVCFSSTGLHLCIFLTPPVSNHMSVSLHCQQLLSSSSAFPSSRNKPAYNYEFYLRGRNLTAASQSTAPPTKTSAICHCCVRGAADTTGTDDRVYLSSVGSRLFMPPSVTSVPADTWLTDKAARPPCCL